MQERPNLAINRCHCMAAMLATSTAFMSGCATDVVYLNAFLPEHKMASVKAVPI